MVKKILDEGSDWAKPKDNYKCQLVARGFSRPSNTAFLTLGTKEEPYQLVLGDASVPEALEVGVESMKKAERCEVTASIEYGYGSPAKNAAHGIPEGDTELFFEVELLDFQKTKESYDMNYDEKLADATRLKEQGSDLLRDGCPRQASKKFDLALRYFAYDKDLSAEQKEAVNKIRLPSLLNMAMLSAKAGDWYTTFENAQKAVDIDPKSIKALYRKAQGLYYNRKDYQATIDVLKKAIELDTDKKFAADLNGLLRVATEQRKKEVAKEKALYQGIFARMAAKKSKEPEPKEDKAEAQPMDVDGREGSAEPTEAAAGSS